MAKKAPRRTAERILETSLAMYNRFGEPNVSTTALAAELGISPGNLYYHFPAKEEITTALFQRCEHALQELLAAAEGVRDVEDAWFFMHSLFERIWQHRFLYRDLNQLLSRNRVLEMRFRVLLEHKCRALGELLQGLRTSGLSLEGGQIPPTATCMAVLATYWLSYEYVRDPRHALEPGHEDTALLRGAQHVLGLLAPHLPPDQRRHLEQLAGDYSTGRMAEGLAA